MIRFHEFIKAFQEALHVTKPLLFELVLFIWAAIEMFKFISSVAFGGE
jgi:hypothetical protein